MGIEEFVLYWSRKEGYLKGVEEGREKGVEEGREKGVEEGREKGVEEGILLGQQKRDYEFVRNLLAHTDFTVERIAQLAAVSPDFVQEVQQQIQGR